jgi:hypothetical protein
MSDLPPITEGLRFLKDFALQGLPFHDRKNFGMSLTLVNDVGLQQLKNPAKEE